MPEHLPLPDPRRIDSRRSRSGTGAPGEPPDPRRHGGKLRGDLASARAVSATPRVVVEGVDPRLVFKIHATTRLALDPRGLTFLGDTTDWTYFVVPSDEEASQLVDELAAYESGDARPVLAAFFGSIVDIEAYGPDDRRGPGLPERPFDGEVLVDLQLWPSNNRQEARRRVGDVRRAVDQIGGRVVAVDDRPLSTTARVSVGHAALEALLGLMVVERARAPLAPYLEPSDWVAVRHDGAEAGSPIGVTIGVLDDVVQMAHPLLDGLVSDLSEDEVGARPAIGIHGTMVAGLAAYGDFDAALGADGRMPGPARIASVRVLEPHPDDDRRTQFIGDEPEHRVVERAIRRLHEAGVRIVNVSITDPDAYAGPHVSLWTETLDRLARELDIVVVVAAGNRPMPFDGLLDTGKHVRHQYPTYVLDDDARLAEPSLAANVVTVGSIARSGAAARADGRSHPEDVAVAEADELSPFSRTGPGVNGTHQSGSLKPEFVDYGGNVVWTGLNRITDRDPGASIVSTALSSDGRLFAVSSGTSFAAPRVARAAAEILEHRPGASANLIRALLGASAETPSAAREQFGDAADAYRAFGYGRPDPRRAVESDRARVVMIHEGEVGADGAVIHPIPIPPEFATGKADRLITVSLAYDPPVRRQRREYIAGHLGLDFYRAMAMDDVEAIVRKQTADEIVALPRNRVRIIDRLVPGSRTCEGSTLQVRRWTARVGTSLDPDDGDTYFLVVKHFMEAWASRLAEQYESQRYALVVQLEDRTRVELDLHAQLEARIRAEAARVRLGS